MPSFHHDGIRFHYRDEGSGLPFVFQHGLGSDISQPFELFQPPAGVRLLAFDARGHGQTMPLGNIAKLSIPCFADDLGSFLDHLQIASAVVGGTSMGAAIAMNFALRYPQRVLGLVLSRPAWLNQPNPPNLQVLALVARLIRNYGPQAASEAFLQTAEYASLLEMTPASAASVQKLFCRPRPLELASCLETIPGSQPCHDLQELEKLAVPTLVLANSLDPIHPLEYGTRLAKSIPGAKFVQITSRSESPDRHINDLQRSLRGFFDETFRFLHLSGASAL